MTEDMIDFSRGFPDPTLIDTPGLAEAARRAVLDRPAATCYGPPAGYEPLRALIATRHQVEPEQVLVTNGSLDGLHLLLETLAPRATIVERPSYDLAVTAIGRHSTLWPLRLDPGGTNLDQLDATLAAAPRVERPRVVYTIPTFQNPTGITIPQPARQQLLALAYRWGLQVIEDDPYRELGWGPAPPDTLLHLDRARRDTVIGLGSFSKTVCPGLRVGYVIAPRALVCRMADYRAYHRYICPGLFAQTVLYEYLTDHPTPSTVRRVLAERAHLMVTALHHHLPDATVTDPGGGYFLWIGLPVPVGGVRLRQAARRHGTDLLTGVEFGVAGALVRLSFAPVSTDRIAEGVRRLAAAVADLTGTGQ